MLHMMLLTAALAVGQDPGPASLPPPALPRAAAPAAADPAPPLAAPVDPAPPLAAAAALEAAPVPPPPPAAGPSDKLPEDAPNFILKQKEPEAAPAEEPPAEAAAPAPRWALMRGLQGTWFGAALDDHRMQIYGWTQMSFNTSTAEFSNQPVVWTDRPNKFLLQQHWTRFEKTVDTAASTPTWGFRSDWLVGTDYRFTLPRGLWNSQLLNNDSPPDVLNQAHQNLYGVDPIAHYLEAYFPNVCRGLDIKVGRFFTPFGYESLEAVSCPLVTRAYCFNWMPPFTHVGFLATLNVTTQWTVAGGLVNGNDVYIDPAEEARFVGFIKYVHPTGRDTVVFGTSVGRGKFNAGDPFKPQTISLMSENAGRNNLQCFDLTWTHTFACDPALAYAMEAMYCYQTGVPTTAAVGIIPGAMIKDNALSGTADWASVVHYLSYAFLPNLTGVLRLETFDDFEGQRTGYEGLYAAITCGMTYKPRLYCLPENSLWIRPEVRYDHYFGPGPGAFDPDIVNTGRDRDIFFAGADVIFRW